MNMRTDKLVTVSFARPRSNASAKRGQAGFTFLELMVTVAILGLLLTLAAPSFGDYIKRQSIRADALVLGNALSAARVEAMTVSLGRSFVCWNRTTTNRSFTSTVDGTTVVHSLKPGELAVMQGDLAPVGLGRLVALIPMNRDSLETRDNDADNCIGFNSLGQLTRSSQPTFVMTYCREAGDATDAVRIEIARGGRVVTRPNTDTDGVGVQTCL